MIKYVTGLVKNVQKQVNELIGENWVVHGDPVSIGRDDRGDDMICQAMTANDNTYTKSIDREYNLEKDLGE
tara:strand:- start:975 stop:1187 length:213 start_codon:yes stop_codon:yes gene_type:complete